MPSLHVAIAVSSALFARAIDRRLAIAFTVFATLIPLGSINLGWHYAIDGYAGIVGAWVIWWAVGWFLGRAVVARLLWGGSRAAPNAN